MKKILVIIFKFIDKIDPVVIIVCTGIICFCLAKIDYLFIFIFKMILALKPDISEGMLHTITACLVFLLAFISFELILAVIALVLYMINKNKL